MVEVLLTSTGAQDLYHLSPDKASAHLGPPLALECLPRKIQVAFSLATLALAPVQRHRALRQLARSRFDKLNTVVRVRVHHLA